MMMRRALTVVMLAMMVHGTDGAAHAAAAPYDVWACRLPDLNAAPTDGWTASGRRVAGAEIGNSCAPSAGFAEPDRALWARYIGSVEKPVELLWAFAAPENTTITTATLWRAARTSSSENPTYFVVETDASRYDLLEHCTIYQQGCASVGSLENLFSPANRIDFYGLLARRLDVHLDCDGPFSGPTCGSAAGAAFKVFRARIGLLDQVTPEIGATVEGSLTQVSQPHEGERSVSFSAKDRGGGISAVGVIVDGRTVVERPPNPSDPACRQPYTLRVPCPLAVSVNITFDTATLANGTHVVQTFATDVSGNRATSSPFVIATRNGSVPNGIGADRAARLTASIVGRTGKPIRGALRFRRSVVLQGSLSTFAGTPIAGATLDLHTRVARPGSVPRVRSVTTDSKGRYTYRVPGGASRDLDVAYRAFTSDESYSAMATARVRVRAAIELRVSRRVLRNGERVRFTGRLVGGPRRQDASMILYAIADRRIPVASLKADARGRFSYAYRFRTVGQRSTFRFQVRSESRPGYPYAAGASNVAKVTVRP
jgi:hypothetical protein